MSRFLRWFYEPSVTVAPAFVFVFYLFFVMIVALSFIVILGRAIG